jgi:hypothetical protein
MTTRVYEYGLLAATCSTNGDQKQAKQGNTLFRK